MGDYAGTYTGVWRDSGVDDSTWNLAPPQEWTDYADLLADETYWTAALTERVPLDIPVTVYRFSDSSRSGRPAAATRAVTVTPGADTTILTYSFNGYGESDGLPQYSYFLRENRAISPTLIVLGEDLQDYTLAGYTDGGCQETLELGPCTVAGRKPHWKPCCRNCASRFWIIRTAPADRAWRSGPGFVPGRSCPAADLPGSPFRLPGGPVFR